MQIEILQEELSKGLSLVNKAVANRAQLAVLSNILFEAKKDGLYLSATDLELGIGVKLNAKIVQEGTTTVPAKTLLEFVGSLNPGKVEMKLDKETLIISSGSYRGKFQTIPADEFPRLPEPKVVEDEISVNFKEFSQAAQMVLFAAARDSLRPVLTGILMEVKKNSLKVVATDGFRLAMKKIKIAFEGEETKPLLVPMRAVSEISKVSGEGEMKIVHVEKANQVIFVVGEVRIVTQMIEGNYPDYNKIVPKDFLSQMTVSRDELLSAVKATYIFARENSNMVKWSLADSEITITGETPERGGAEAKVAMVLEGDGGEVVFNAKFVMDFLGVSNVQMITFGMGEHLAPCAFREQNNEDFLYVVMPINA